MTENVVRKTDVPDLGWSSPVVWGDHVFVTSVVSAGGEPGPRPGFYAAGVVKSDRTTISIPTPFARHGLLYVSSGYIGDALRPTYAIRPGASGGGVRRQGLDG